MGLPAAFPRSDGRSEHGQQIWGLEKLKTKWPKCTPISDHYTAVQDRSEIKSNFELYSCYIVGALVYIQVFIWYTHSFCLWWSGTLARYPHQLFAMFSGAGFTRSSSRWCLYQPTTRRLYKAFGCYTQRVFVMQEVDFNAYAPSIDMHVSSHSTKCCLNACTHIAELATCDPSVYIYISHMYLCMSLYVTYVYAYRYHWRTFSLKIQEHSYLPWKGWDPVDSNLNHGLSNANHFFLGGRSNLMLEMYGTNILKGFLGTNRANEVRVGVI